MSKYMELKSVRVEKGLCVRCGKLNEMPDKFVSCNACRHAQVDSRLKTKESHQSKTDETADNEELINNSETPIQVTVQSVDVLKLTDKFNIKREQIKNQTMKILGKEIDSSTDKKTDVTFRIPQYLRLKLLAEYEHEGYTKLDDFVSDILSMYFDNKKVFDNVFRTTNTDCVYQTDQVFIRIAKEIYISLLSTVDSIEIQLKS